MTKSNHTPQNIYSSACVQALEQEYCSTASAAVVSSCLVSSHGLGARVMSRIYNGGRQAIYTATVGAMLVNNMALPAQAVEVYGTTSQTLACWSGSEIIYDGGVANSTTVNYHGFQIISNGGVANSTTANYYGSQIISDGGVANNTTVISGGSQFIREGAWPTTHW